MTDRTKLALRQWKCEPHHISPMGPRPVTLDTGDIAVIYLHSKLLVVAVLLAAPTALPAADEAEEDDGSRRCINTRTLRNTDVLDDTHIVFRMVGSKIYLNTLKTNCRGLSRERRFSYTSYLLWRLIARNSLYISGNANRITFPRRALVRLHWIQVISR